MKPGETKDSAWVIAETEAPLPISLIDETLSDTSKHPLFDKMLDKYEPLKELPQGFKTLHRINKSGFLMPARDYVLSLGRLVLSSGEIIHTSLVVEDASMPEQDKVTRSQFMTGVWILT